MRRSAYARGHGAVPETRTVPVGPYEVLLTRKRIKRAYLRVDDDTGSVRVSAPPSMTLKEVVAFVEGQAPWIERRRAQLRSATPASPRRGHGAKEGTVLLWGVPTSLAAVEPRAAAIADADPDRAEKLVAAALKRELQPVAEPLVRRYEQVMGVRVDELRFRDMQTRWGTCNVKAHRVWLAVSLAHFPRPCTELIVVHELSHLIEAGHGPRFKACMDRYLPDWREREELLKRVSRGR